MTLISDKREGSISFTFANGDTETVTYTAADLGDELPEDSKSGYSFKGWKIGEKTYTTLTEELLNALNGKVLDAEPDFRSNSSGGSSSSSNTITVDSGKHGTVKVTPKQAGKGDTVTITVNPDKGYELDELTVTDKNGNELKLTKKGDNKYTFKMPASKVKIEATFAEISEEPTFIDVPADHWAADAIEWAYENGYMNGYQRCHLQSPGQCDPPAAVDDPGSSER